MADQINVLEKYPGRYELDVLLSDIYNAIYAKSGKYKTKFIDVANLKMIRFKISDYDLDIVFDRIQHSGNLPTGIENVEQIIFKRQGETHMSNIRIIPYEDKESVNNMTNPVNVNQVIKTLLSELVVNERSKNILLPVLNIDIEGNDVSGYPKVKPLVDPNKFYSVQITEKFYSLMTLDRFLKDYPLESDVIKSIIYQAVDVLHQINVLYPGFRHNQFYPEMIDCYLKQPQQDSDITFPELKVGNFFLAEIEEIVPNNYIKKLDIPVTDNNAYSDLYQLLNHLWNNNLSDIEKYQDIVSLFNQILPKKIRSDKKYLTKELWNSLSDEEKSDLRLKNIRDNPIFSRKDALQNSVFIEQNMDELSTGGSSELATTEDLPLDTLQEEIFGEDDSDEPKIRDDPANQKILTDDEVEFDEIELNTIESEKNLDSQSNKFGLNKKYYDYGIDSMSNKKSDNLSSSDKKQKHRNNRRENKSENQSENQSENKSEKFSDKNYSESDKIERTESERRRIKNTPSRIVNISDTDVGARSQPRGRTKSYRGRRYIGANDGFTSNPGMSQMNPQTKSQADLDTINNLINTNGIPSRINNIGALLGANPQDYRGNNNSAQNYSQIAQQMASTQYQAGMNQQPGNPQMIPGFNPAMGTNPSIGQMQYGVNQPADMYGQMQGMMGQSTQQQQNPDPRILEYLKAAGQLQQGTPQYNTGGQTQVDQNTLNAINSMITSQGQGQQQYPSQMVGGQRNPFFFQ